MSMLPATCVAQAARVYQVSPARIEASLHENKSPGSSLIGVARIPSGWLPVFRLFPGTRLFTRQTLARDTCAAIYAAGWIMSFTAQYSQFQQRLLAWRQDRQGRAMSDAERPWSGLVAYASRETGVPVPLIEAVMQQESGFRADAVSGAGAVGLMQLMPATARRLGVTDIADPAQNVIAGTVLLERLLVRFHGRLPLVLAAYNAGATAVSAYGGIPPYAETRRYVPSVMALFHDWENRN